MQTFQQQSDAFCPQVQTLPDAQHVPDHQLGVESVQADGHPGCRDAVSSVQHVSGQRAALHDLLDRCGQVSLTCRTFSYIYSLNWLHYKTVGTIK